MASITVSEAACHKLAIQESGRSHMA